MHARGLRPRGVRECQASYRHPRCGLPLVGRRRHPNFQNFAAQYPAYMCPYQRLAPCLTTDRPWLGVGMVRQPLPHDSFLRYTPVVYPGASPRSLMTVRRVRCPAFPLQHRHGYAADLSHGLRADQAHRRGESSRFVTRMCAAIRPTSTRLEPVMDLRGFDHWFLLSYTFPPCLPDPSRLAVPTRSVVIRAAPALPCVPRVRLPIASVDRCDSPQEGSFHPLTVKQRLVAHSSRSTTRPNMGAGSIWPRSN